MSNTVQSGLVSAGFATALGMAQEATYGTAVAPAIYLPFQQHNLAIKNDLIQNQAVRHSAGMAAPGAGTASVTGDITTYVDVSTIGLILAAAFGIGSDTVTGSAAPYTHAFTGKSKANSYTLTSDDNNGVTSSYVGCKIASLDLSCKKGDFLMAKASITGQTLTSSATPLSPSYSTAQPIEFAHLAAGASTLNGTSVGITDFTVSVKNTLKANVNSTGGRFATGLTTVAKEVSGSFTVNYDGNLGNLINSALWGSNTAPVGGVLPTNALVLTFTLPSAAGSFEISIPNFTISEAPLTRKKGDVLSHAVKFISSESTAGAGDDLEVILTNSTATAYA